MAEPNRPAPSEYGPHFERYISLVSGDDVLALLERQGTAVTRIFSAVSPDRAGHRYAEGKWSIREVLGHIIDAERVFAYRALCLARGEKKALPGFDENAYATASAHDAVALRELVQEFSLVRAGNLLMLRHLPPEAWTRVGTASEHPVSARAVPFIMAGHVEHHLGVLRDRYRVGV